MENDTDTAWPSSAGAASKGEYDAEAAEIPASAANPDIPEASHSDHPAPRLQAMLDTLSEVEPKQQEQEEISSASEAESTLSPEAAADPNDTAADTEEAALLKGVKSERSRTRIQTMLAERRQVEGELQQIRGMFQATGMTPEELAQTFEFGSLVRSGEAADLHTALQMVEAQRASLCQKLGIELPGVDALADYPDLGQEVQQGTLSRARALEMATLRRQHQAIQQHVQTHEKTQQDQVQFEIAVNQGKQSIATYLQQNAHKVDHAARIQAIQQHFAQPSNVQAFVQTYQPTQWEHAIKWMYEQIRIAPAPRSTTMPLRSSSAALGQPGISGQSAPADRLAQRMEAMGL